MDSDNEKASERRSDEKRLNPRRRHFTTLDRSDFDPNELTPSPELYALLEGQAEDCILRLKSAYPQDDIDDLIKATSDGFFRIVSASNRGNMYVNDESAARFWLFTMAKRALWTIWESKKKIPRGIPLDFEGLASVLGESLTGTEIGDLWATAVHEDRTYQIESDFRNLMQTLPRQFQIVGHAIIDNFPHRPTHKELADHIKENYGHSFHPKTVSRIRTQIRKLFRDFVK